jgi:hypothetical protein
MLKIWLTWLQPRLGVFGTALVLSNPISAYAAPKPVAVNNTKVPTQPSIWSSAKSTGTTLSPALLSGIPATPDLAVRQLAINSMMTSGLKPTIAATKVPVGLKPTVSVAKTPQSNRKAIASFVAPSAKFKKLSAKATKPQPVKHSVAAALARAIDPQTPLPVPGLFIGNTDVRVSERILPRVKPSIGQPLSAVPEIGAPTPLSAMMSAKTAVDPFPVVRPEMMGKLQSAPVVASASKNSAPHALNPIAVIPAKQPQAVAPKQADLKTEAPHSLDPIAAIPSGLQRLLGNNLNSQPKVVTAPIVQATATVRKSSSFLALKQFVSPAKTTPTPVSMASLQLATAQAYTSVPKFDIPGEKIFAVRPTVNLLGVNRVEQKSFTTKVVGRKSDVSLMNDRQLTPATKQSWTVVTRSNNLGGLILGSQSLPTVTKFVGLLPMNTLTTPAAVGLPARNLANFN